MRGSNAVGRWKLAVVIMLSVTAGLVVSSSYIFLSRATEDEFRKSVRQVTGQSGSDGNSESRLTARFSKTLSTATFDFSRTYPRIV